MSAESPKRAARGVPAIAPPEPVSDRSIIDSVTGFINEVTLTNVPQADPKDTIQWVRFESTADVSDPSFGEDWDLESGVPPPLLLILGYGTGIQVWAIPANGEAVEVLSWRHGIIRALKVLPLPINSASELADEPSDSFAHKRPLIAICDSCQTGSIGPQFCSMNIISLRDGDALKSIKFKSTILDITANRTSIVVTFSEKIAVFDARTLEDRLTITTCHPSPGLSPNPIALGPRWLAYAERKLIPSKRSGGGCDCDGVSSYTATMLNAAKTLSKGLRELGEQVAAGLTGSVSAQTSSVTSNGTIDNQQLQPGIITILDIKYPFKDASPTAGGPVTTTGNDPMIAHFVAHAEVIAAMAFDASGLLLISADKRGHDFHVFRIHPHPCGSSSAAIHHLYILHRGDTTAKVQDMVFSLDSRWAAVTTARGTTHVFPVTPYGGPATYRTHGSAEVVNRLSRFHRSAGLTADGRSSSPVFYTDNGSISSDPYHNPRIPSFPRPCIIAPLKQLRQPIVLSASNTLPQLPSSGSSGQRQRHSSGSEDSGNIFRVCATFARARDWLLHPINMNRDTSALRNQRKAADSLFVMAAHGSMIQYDLEPRYLSNIPAGRQNDDSAIELHVEARAQWNLLRKDISVEIQPPLAYENWLLKNRMDPKEKFCQNEYIDHEDSWLSQVEMATSSGPHRRLWMGPQFVFKTYNTPSGSPLHHIDTEAVEIGINIPTNRPARSSDLNRGVQVVIDETSSSFEQSPNSSNQYHDYMDSDDQVIAPTDSQLREDLADAMRESPRDSGLSSYGSASSRTVYVSVGKVVNPLGTVTTITESPDESITAANKFTEAYSSGAHIHENSDEAMFRPYVAVISGTIDGGKLSQEQVQKPAPIGQKLIVPVIDGTESIRQTELARQEEFDRQQDETVARFETLMTNKKDKSKKNDKVKDSSGKEGKTWPNAGQKKFDEAPLEVKSADSLESSIKSKLVKPEPAAAAVQACEIQEITEVVTIKLGKKANKASTKSCGVDQPAVKNENKPITSVLVNESKLPIMSEAKPVVECSVTTTGKSKKARSAYIPKEADTLITDDILKDEDIQPIIEAANTTLSDILKGQCREEPEIPSYSSYVPDQSSDREKMAKFNLTEMQDCSTESTTTEEVSAQKLAGDEGIKLKKSTKKQKKLEKIAAEASKVGQSTTSPTVTKSESTEFTFTLKKRSSPPIDNQIEVEPITQEPDDIAILENFDKTLTGDFTNIQDSLLNPVVASTISVRKSTLKDRASSEEKTVIITKKDKKKNGKTTKEIDVETNCSDPDLSYVDPVETFEPDSLSFKSTCDDPVSLINFENPQAEAIQSINNNKSACDDVESTADGQFSDCKSFDLVGDDSTRNTLKQSDTMYSFDLVLDDNYTQLKQSDTNSSDETEDSSQGKNIKSKLTDYDDELQPLISSATYLQCDTTLEITKQMHDALPEETNQSDSTKQQQGNKKKSRKKRR